MSQQQLIQKKDNVADFKLKSVNKIENPSLQQSSNSGMQNMIGNHGVLRLSDLWPIQAKLKISELNDPCEQEADRVADEIMRIPEPEINRKDETRSLNESHFQKNTNPKIDSQFVTGENLHPLVNQALQIPGQSLDAATRAYFEPRFGYDLSGVRLHTGIHAKESASALNAQAFTVGQNVIFGSGYYRPGSVTGNKLIAHELAHIIQQGCLIRTSSNCFIDRLGKSESHNNSNLGGRVRPSIADASLIHRKNDSPLIETRYLEPRSIYLIKESVHSVISLPLPSILGLYSSLMKVIRSVVQLNTSWIPEKGKTSTWEAIKDWLGIEKIKRKYTGEHSWVVAYVGFRNFVDIAGKRIEVYSPGIMMYGNDPIPSIQLYGNTKVKFESKGGETAPTATMLYDGYTNKLMPQIDDFNAIFKLTGAKFLPGPEVEEKKQK